MLGTHSGRSTALKAMGALTVVCAVAARVAPSCKAAVARGTPAAPPVSNRWVSRAISTRGGSDAAASGDEAAAAAAAREESGVMSEVQIAMSSFNDIVGEKLLTVDNPKKGTTKEVCCTNYRMFCLRRSTP